MKQVLAEIDDLILPIMPATARELRGLLGRRNTRNEHFQTILLRDPAATIALYRRVERSRPGTVATITDPAHAISMIGLDIFRRMLAQLPEIKNKGSNRLLTAAHAYSQAAHAAFYAEKLSEELHTGQGHEIPVAALLQNPAVLALWHLEPDSAIRASNAVRDGVPYDVAFSAELGEQLNEANLRLAETWHFPSLAINAMGDWDPFNKQPQIVTLANTLAQTSASGWRQEEVELNFEILEDFLKMPHDTAASRWHQIAADAAREMTSLDYPLPAFELLLTGAEEEADVDDPRLPEFGRPKPKPPTSPPPDTDLHSVLSEIMHRLRSSAQIERAVFILPNPGKTQLKTRLALGGDKTDAIRQLKLAMTEKNIFSLLLGKQQSIWVRDSNRAKFQALMPEKLKKCIHPDGFYAMSIFVSDKPLGILYADGGTASDASYRQFRLLCQEVHQVLEGKNEVAA